MTIQRSLFRYIFDASSLINIERNRKVSFLRKNKASVIIPEKIAYEVGLDPHIPSNAPLRKLILKYPELVASFENNEEDEYLLIRRQIGIDDGEAAAIAISLKRRLPLVIDDMKGKNKAENHELKPWGGKSFWVKINKISLISYVKPIVMSDPGQDLNTEKNNGHETLGYDSRS